MAKVNHGIFIPAAIQDLSGNQYGDYSIEKSVLDGLQEEGMSVVFAEAFDLSGWIVKIKVNAILADGTPKSYFLKYATEEDGNDGGDVKLWGEHMSMEAIHSLVPGLVPAPHCAIWNGTGTCIMSDFLDMDTASAPDPMQFTARLAELHKKSKSPTGMFGFDDVTCNGKIPHEVGWEEDWAVFFSKLLRGILKHDTKANGAWPKLETAANRIINAVIPRLSGVLQADGRELKPCLIHGDCWEGNVGTRRDNGDIILYDAGSFYAHNEMDLGIWRCQWVQSFREPIYSQSYRANYEAAKPVEVWDDRNRLYSLKYNLSYSGRHPGSVTRETAYNDMCYLCEKYASLEGLGKYDSRKDPSVTGARIEFHT